MRITFLLPQLNLSGGTRVVAIYAQKLAEAGHTVHVYSVRQAPPVFKQRVKALLKGRGWLKRPSPEPSYFDHAGVPCHFLEADEVHDDAFPDADVLVITWWETAEDAARLSPRKGAKVYFIQGHDAAFPGRVQAERIKASYGLPAHLVVVSPWLQELFRNEYGRPDASLVPNSVDTKLFESPVRGKQSPPTVGTLYSNRYHIKGCDIAFAAVEKARQTVPDLRFVAFGATDPVLELPVGTEFVKSPPQDEIRKIYARCDAWLFPSRIDGFGLPILEAMACRTPVIATPVGAATDLVERGGGCLIAQEDVDAMARAIVRFAQMGEDEWKVRSARANDVAHEYTWDDAAAKMLATFEQAIAEQAPPREVRAEASTSLGR